MPLIKNIKKILRPAHYRRKEARAEARRKAQREEQREAQQREDHEQHLRNITQAAINSFKHQEEQANARFNEYTEQANARLNEYTEQAIARLNEYNEHNESMIKERLIKKKVDYAILEEPLKSTPYETLREMFAHHAHDKNFDWGWSDIHYNRLSLVNLLVSKYDYDTCRYLEIGCFTNELFNTVVCGDKTGIDPAQGGTHKMTSDKFFAQNKKTFDVVFIDGLHHYEQVHKDAINAIACLKAGGWIAFHDFLPTDWMEQHRPALKGAWTGDCWKLACELAQSPDIDFRILQIDHGVGVMRLKRENAAIVDLSDTLRDAQFDTFVNALPNLPVVSWQDGVKWINGETQ